MKHSEVEELLGVYALDALLPDEAAEVEAHLARCGRCRAEVAQHRQTAAALAGLLETPGGHGGGPAPEGLWERIALELDSPEEADRPRIVPFAPPQSQPQPARATAASVRWLASAAVVALLLAAGLGAMLVRQDSRIDNLSERERAQAELAAALTDPTSRRVQLASTDGAHSLGAVVTDRGVAYLVSTGALPTLDADRTYQLWAIEGAIPRSLAVLGRELGAVTVFQLDGKADVLAITVEPAGGVDAPTTMPIVHGQLQQA